MFILGHSDHVLRLKQSYMQQVPTDLPKPKQSVDVDNCDKDLLWPPRRLKEVKSTVQKKWVEKEWHWGPEQQELFDHIKKCISENAMAGADPEMQYHLATDASLTRLGGVLFQLLNTPENTELTASLRVK